MSLTEEETNEKEAVKTRFFAICHAFFLRDDRSLYFILQALPFILSHDIKKLSVNSLRVFCFLQVYYKLSFKLETL